MSEKSPGWKVAVERGVPDETVLVLTQDGNFYRVVMTNDSAKGLAAMLVQHARGCPGAGL